MNQLHMQAAIKLAQQGMRENQGGPFGAVIVKEDKIIGQGFNRVLATKDPTAHAEIEAIRMASKTLGNFSLAGCVLYTSCEPCPMCLGAIYWARLDQLFYAATQEDAANIGFDDAFFYAELSKPHAKRNIPMQSLAREAALEIFMEWNKKMDKTNY